jgi:hypothetical protein
MKTEKKDFTHITLTIFYIVYSFSALEHHNQHSLFMNMFFNMFVLLTRLSSLLLFQVVSLFSPPF